MFAAATLDNLKELQEQIAKARQSLPFFAFSAFREIQAAEQLLAELLVSTEMSRLPLRTWPPAVSLN